MRKHIVIAVFICLLSVNSFAYASNFGSPEPTAALGKFSLGIGYTHYSSEWKPSSNSFFDIPDVWQDSNPKSDQFYVQGSFGIMKNWGIYLRFGGADIKVKDAFWGLSDFKDDYRPFVTGGIRGLVYNGGSYGIGPFAQANYFISEYKDDLSATVIDGADIIHASDSRKYKNIWDASAGIAFFMKNSVVSLYGGPFLYWGRAKVEDKVEVTVNDVPEFSGSDSTTYKEKGALGGFLGLQIPIGQGWNLEVEGQAKKKISFGTAVTYSF